MPLCSSDDLAGQGNPWILARQDETAIEGPFRTRRPLLTLFRFGGSEKRFELLPPFRWSPCAGVRRPAQDA